VRAQSQNEIDRHRAILGGKEKRTYQEARENKNEFQAIFGGLFLMYKTIFSSQDNNVCSFTPSCSEFGLMAVKKYGPIVGGIRTMDRLSRCNGLSPAKYQMDFVSKLLVDKP
jgi:uncharacterized protein